MHMLVQRLQAFLAGQAKQRIPKDQQVVLAPVSDKVEEGSLYKIKHSPLAKLPYLQTCWPRNGTHDGIRRARPAWDT